MSRLMTTLLLAAVGGPILGSPPGRVVAGDGPPERSPDLTAVGRLVRPDGSPAAGVPVRAGVYVVDPGSPRVSWDHGDWPNHTVGVTTDADGRFRAALPRPGADWVRVGTGPLDFGGIEDDEIRARDPGHVLLEYAPLEADMDPGPDRTGEVDFGTLTLRHGVLVKGRVLDAEGRPLAGVRVMASGRHGPYAGRRTLTDAAGAFAFGPMNPGRVTLSVDARPRDEKGEAASRDVRAVFGPVEVDVPESGGPVELEVRALPHREVAFEWIDRRPVPGPVSYYGGYRVTGRLPREGDPRAAWWTAETETVARGGRKFLVVKVPKDVVDPTLHLPGDEKSTPSYEDSRGRRPRGTIELGDLGADDRRVIFTDPPEP